MKAELLLRERFWLSETLRVELVIWQVPLPVPGSTHSFKYRLALISGDVCVLRYDNEAGKGDHNHEDEAEIPYQYVSLEQVQIDFWADVASWRARQ